MEVGGGVGGRVMGGGHGIPIVRGNAEDNCMIACMAKVPGGHMKGRASDGDLSRADHNPEH